MRQPLILRLDAARGVEPWGSGARWFGRGVEVENRVKSWGEINLASGQGDIGGSMIFFLEPFYVQCPCSSC